MQRFLREPIDSRLEELLRSQPRFSLWAEGQGGRISQQDFLDLVEIHFAEISRFAGRLEEGGWELQQEHFSDPADAAYFVNAANLNAKNYRLYFESLWKIASYGDELNEAEWLNHRAIVYKSERILGEVLHYLSCFPDPVYETLMAGVGKARTELTRIIGGLDKTQPRQL